MQKGFLAFVNGFAELQGTVMSAADQKGTDATLPSTWGCNLNCILVTMSQGLGVKQQCGLKWPRSNKTAGNCLSLMWLSLLSPAWVIQKQTLEEEKTDSNKFELELHSKKNNGNQNYQHWYNPDPRDSHSSDCHFLVINRNINILSFISIFLLNNLWDINAYKWIKSGTKVWNRAH